MERNNPYITRIYDYEEYLLPHPNRESFDQHWRKKVQNSAKVHVEIGCGSGKYLMELARNSPDETFFGLELRLKRLVLAAKKIKREQLENILLMRERGEYLDDYFEEGSINVLHINFPDPWSKKAKRKHRILSTEYLTKMHPFFRSEGKLCFKTDHLEYFQTVTGILNKLNSYTIDQYTEDLHQSKYATGNILTEFEMLFKSKGNPPIGYLRAKALREK